MAEELPTYSIWEHLRELKSRLVKALMAIIIGVSVAFAFSEKLFYFLKNPVINLLPDKKLVFLSPFEKFVSYLKVSVIFGIILSSPFWFYQIYAFLAPALYVQEKKIFWRFFMLSMIFLMLGLSFAYWVAAPTAFRFLINFGDATDVPLITISEYLNFILYLLAGFGIAFQLPVLLIFLGWLGIITAQSLKAHRKYIILILSIITAIITPPDVLSMLIMLGPLWLLFELSIWIIWFLQRQNPQTSQNRN